jgi:hypothetical protein
MEKINRLLRKHRGHKAHSLEDKSVDQILASSFDGVNSGLQIAQNNANITSNFYSQAGKP